MGAHPQHRGIGFDPPEEIQELAAALMVAPPRLEVRKNPGRAFHGEDGVDGQTGRARLMEALTGQFDRELQGSLQRIGEAISPYTRFVRSERDRLEAARADLRRVRDGLEALKARLAAA